jgi:hypothetical protein
MLQKVATLLKVTFKPLRKVSSLIRDVLTCSCRITLASTRQGQLQNSSKITRSNLSLGLLIHLISTLLNTFGGT